MTMLLYNTDRTDVRRWSLSAGFVVAIHAAIMFAALLGYSRPDLAGTASQLMTIDLVDAPPNPERKLDVAPGPQMQEAPAPTPEPQKQEQAEQEIIPPAPLQQTPVVVAPPEQKQKPKPDKDKPKPIAEKPRPDTIPAPRTTAPPQAAQAARANYMGMLTAHLQRFKQYPPGARSAGEQGVATLSFTVSRNGQASGGRIAKSSGSAALDAETLAMLRRAQPLPSFPPEMAQSSLSFNAPIRFSLR